MADPSHAPAGLMRVLVTCGGGFQGQAVITGLRRAAVWISMTDCAIDTPNRYLVDRFHVVPPVEPAAPFVAALRRICQADRIDLVIPSSDIELQVLADHRPALAELGVEVAVSDSALVRRLRHKGELYRDLRAAGFPVLPWFERPGALPGELPGALPDELPDALAGDAIATGEPGELIRFPILGKPVAGWGSRGLVVLRSAGELRARRHELSDGYVWQPLLGDFIEYSVDGAIGAGGRLSPWVVRVRIRTSGGFATITDAAGDPDATRLAEDLAGYLRDRGGRGIFNCQLLRAEERLLVSDVNPRIGTSAVFGLHRGINLPLFLCGCLRPEMARPAAGTPGGPLRMVRHLADTWIEAPGTVDVRGVVFDLDDTLVDHKQWILRKLDLVLDHLGIAGRPRRDMERAAVQILEEGNRSHLFDALAAACGLPAALRDQLIDTYRRVEPATVPLYPDVTPVLAALAADGYRLAVVTDNPPASHAVKLRLSWLESLLDAVVFTRDTGAEKPHPAGFERAAARLGVPPEQLAAVGDNPYRDAAGALAAGYQAAFWVARPGAFLNPHPAAIARHLGAAAPVRRVEDLRQLRWYLAERPGG